MKSLAEIFEYHLHIPLNVVLAVAAFLTLLVCMTIGTGRADDANRRRREAQRGLEREHELAIEAVRHGLVQKVEDGKTVWVKP